MSAAVLRHRYQRLLAIYPSDWREANGPVVLDTLLEAAGPDRRWPSPREAFALLVGGVRTRIEHMRPDAPERGRCWLEGLHLGAILLALLSLALAVGPIVSWVGHGFGDVSGNVPAYDGSSAAYDSVWAVLAAAVAVPLLRGRVKAALVVAAASVPASLLAQWAIGVDPPEGTVVEGPAILVLRVVGSTLPLLAILAVLVWRGGAKPRSWRGCCCPRGWRSRSGSRRWCRH